MTHGAAVVLAAGASQRMGRPKAHLPYSGGTFLSVILDRLRPLDLAWTSVVAHPNVRLEAPGCQMLVNPQPDSGPIGSIQVGLRAGAGRYPWLLAVPVDHPGVAGETYRELVEAAARGGGHLWVPALRGRRGHPVVWGSPCYEDLLRVPPGKGAFWVLDRHREWRVEVPVDDPEILRNVDTPEAYRRLLEERGG